MTIQGILSDDELRAAAAIVAEVDKCVHTLPPPRTNLCQFAVIYTFLMNEIPGVLADVNDYIDDCSSITKKDDLNEAIKHLEQYYINNTNVDHDSEPYKKTKRYYEVLLENKNNIPEKKLPEVIKLTYRILFKAVEPEHPNNRKEGVNTSRGNEIVEENSKWNWGKLIGGAALAVFGIALTVVASASIAASFGASTPLIKLGLSATALGASYVAGEMMLAAKQRNAKRSALIAGSTAIGAVAGTVIGGTNVVSATTTASVLASDTLSGVVPTAGIPATTALAASGFTLGAGIAALCRGIHSMWSAAPKNTKFYKAAKDALYEQEPGVNHQCRV